jgi:hypothetical protein
VCHGGKAGLKRLDHLLSIHRVHQRSAEHHVADDRRTRVDELRIDDDHARDVAQLHLAAGPAIANLDGLVQ